MKRVIDLTVSLGVLLMLCPIIFTIAILVRFKMGSPILFTQERPGLNGEPFYLYKFRTMKNLKDGQGNALSDELRLTSFGKFLRKYSLDEFPQLLNVLKGEMSLVGPRPFLMEYLALYTDEQMVRHNVKPGITGWAQVNGRNAISWEEKFNLDIWYVKNHNLFLDFKILILTAIKVVKREGITQQGQVTVEKFSGSNEVM
ncbi:sugar transferase [Bacillus sp. AFS002410]|uniref:sugar transferase n=1 Tax=Bacillus sp. AFS002410 TaxID=2033481 RepID=UPI000BEFAE10|nr:sugar transferase [Bacillus sp. AFS002410]PEJ58460.1 sugar transferase [Bacillus sp. AFS002410]